jgi:hypothetical protein
MGSTIVLRKRVIACRPNNLIGFRAHVILGEAKNLSFRIGRDASLLFSMTY